MNLGSKWPLYPEKIGWGRATVRDRWGHPRTQNWGYRGDFHVD